MTQCLSSQLIEIYFSINRTLLPYTLENDSYDDSFRIKSVKIQGLRYHITAQIRRKMFECQVLGNFAH